MENKKMTVHSNFSSEAGLGLPISRTSISKNGEKYMPFSNSSNRYGDENLYPQQLAKLALEAPTHGAAIRIKQMMILGEGIDLELLTPQLSEKLDNLNGCGGTINDLLEQISWDYSMFGGFSMKCKWNGKGEIAELEHVPFTDVRVGYPNEMGKIDYYVVSNNWDRTIQPELEKNYVIGAFDPDYFENGVELDENGLPNPTESQMEQAEQLIYYWSYTPYASNGMRYYPLPDYIACLDQIITEHSIAVSNQSKIYNGIGGKTIVMFPFVCSDEEKRENSALFQANFTGADKDGSIIQAYVNSPEDLPSITQLEGLDANTYIELEKSTKQNIITGHKVPAILLEYNYGGGFNNRADEMDVAFKLFQRTSIKSKQANIVRCLNRVISYMGFDEKLSIIPFKLDEDNNTIQGESSIENS